MADELQGESRGAAARRIGPRGALMGVFLFALAVRVWYAHGMPLSGDESVHLQMARQISLRSDFFYAPLGAAGTNHPLAALYVTALARWAGGGNVFPVRLAFIALSLFGLAGFYLLAKRLFGARIAWIALALAAADRHLVALSPVFLESPSVIFLAPWAMLLMHECLNRGRRRDWLLAGLTFGAGCWFSTVFLAMLAAFGLYILLTGRTVAVLKSRWMYAGLAVMAAVMAPNVVWNLLHGSVNYERHVSKVGSLGLSPRVAILYVGDLLILLKDPLWIVQNLSGKIYLPVYVPCQWATGLAYLILAAFSLRQARQDRVILLLSVIGSFLILATILGARERWNEFTWASSTVFPVILLAAFSLDRMPGGRWGEILAGGVLAWSVGSLLWFLAGPKWGYFCPEWERAYVGRVLAIQADWSLPPDRAFEEVRRRTGEAISRHPNSAIAWFFLGTFAGSIDQREAAYRRSLELAPGNAPVRTAQARDRMAAGRWDRARELLRKLAAEDPQSASVRRLLAQTEYETGSYAAAAEAARQWRAIKPEDESAYEMLFRIYDSQGDHARAETALQGFLARHPLGPAAALLTLAEGFQEEEKPEKALAFLERAIAARPRLAEHEALIGSLFEQLGRPDRAMRHYEAAARRGSADPNIHFRLAQWLEQHGEVGRALEYYERAVALDPDFGEARRRLDALRGPQNRGHE